MRLLVAIYLLLVTFTLATHAAVDIERRSLIKGVIQLSIADTPQALPSRASLGLPPDAPLNVFPATCTQWASGISWIAGIYWYSGSQVGYILANDSMVYPPVQNFNSLSDIIPLFYQVLAPLCTSAALLLGQTASVPLINPNTTLPFTYVRTFNSLSGNLYAYSSDDSIQISSINSSYINFKVNISEISSGVVAPHVLAIPPAIIVGL